MQVQRFKTEYIAGFFDGEGCIYLNPSRRKNTVKGKEYYYPDFQLILGQSSDKGKEILTLIKEQLGFGKVRQAKRAKNATNDAYVIQISGRKALKILKELEPHLFIKQQKAIAAIQFMENYYAN